MPIVICGIYTYPVKGCAAVSLAHAGLDWNGLRWDRRWMILDRRGKFVTQRPKANAKMALIRPCVTTRGSSTELELIAPGMSSFKSEVPARSQLRKARIWDDRVDTTDMGDTAAEWLSSYLGKSVRLVFCELLQSRATRSSPSGTGAKLAFADGYPLTLATIESLADLNRRLEEPVPMSRFRPNIVVMGCEPWEEDSWEGFTISNFARFEVAGPCPRCNVTTVCQDTGVRSSQPLAMLRTFRTQEYMRNGATKRGVMFAINVNPLTQGGFRVGDRLHVQYKE